MSDYYRQLTRIIAVVKITLATVALFRFLQSKILSFTKSIEVEAYSSFSQFSTVYSLNAAIGAWLASALALLSISMELWAGLILFFASKKNLNRSEIHQTAKMWQMVAKRILALAICQMFLDEISFSFDLQFTLRITEVLFCLYVVYRLRQNLEFTDVPPV